MPLLLLGRAVHLHSRASDIKRVLRNGGGDNAPPAVTAAGVLSQQHAEGTFGGPLAESLCALECRRVRNGVAQLAIAAEPAASWYWLRLGGWHALHCSSVLAHQASATWVLLRERITDCVEHVKGSWSVLPRSTRCTNQSKPCNRCLVAHAAACDSTSRSAHQLSPSAVTPPTVSNAQLLQPDHSTWRCLRGSFSQQGSRLHFPLLNGSRQPHTALLTTAAPPGPCRCSPLIRLSRSSSPARGGRKQQCHVAIVTYWIVGQQL